MTRNRVLATFIAAVSISACERTEPLHNRDYYDALGSERTWVVLDACGQRKEAFKAAGDADGAQDLGKSNRGLNCVIAASAEASRTAQALGGLAAQIKAAPTQAKANELANEAEKQVHRWDPLVSAFPDWGPTLSPTLAPAYDQVTSAKSGRAWASAIGNLLR